MRFFLLFAALGLLALGQAAAANEGGTDSEAILAQQRQIRAEAMAGKGRFKDLDPARRSELFAQQDEVTRLLTGTSRTSELSETDRIAVFNALEAVEAIVNQAEDERMVCERHKPVGSNRLQTVCKTVAQRRAEREAASTRGGVQCVDAWNSGICRKD
ncbi:hypothetical protein EDC50_2250 [Vulcaniibacterium tengchongense]|uniref:Uncharacterized protein n=2 Tax=Vulcaniibacterium tengchongense TaxID=1273429 RepID=A0A3N4VIS7_9GAMM|nr:hypothetical protein EDC50_2250 [Vulcaniibacterium tengchongense]